MKVRHRRRAAVLLATASLASGIGSLTTATPAVAAGAAKIAGTGTAKTGGTPLNMRRSPSSRAELAGSVANGGTVWIMCQVIGDPVTGTVRSTSAWDRLANNTYVSDAYVLRASFPVPTCTGSAPVLAPRNNAIGPIPVVSAPKPPSVGAWQLPVAAGLVSGFRTVQRPTHDGVDLGAARYTPIHAAAAGTVVRVVCNVSTDNCDVDGNRSLTRLRLVCRGAAPGQHRHPVLPHGAPADRERRTGGREGHRSLVTSARPASSSGPHLHFEVHVNAPPATHANAISPITFMRARGLTIA